MVTKNYSADSIEVLEGLDPVKKRPGMYTDTTRPNHLAQEVIDNSVDEALEGRQQEGGEHDALQEEGAHEDERDEVEEQQRQHEPEGHVRRGRAVDPLGVAGRHVPANPPKTAVTVSPQTPKEIYLPILMANQSTDSILFRTPW